MSRMMRQASEARSGRAVSWALLGSGLAYNLLTSPEFTESDYVLEVKVGSGRGTGGSCGRVSNVAFILNEQGRRVMVIKGRGYLGTCELSIFDDMSQALATFEALYGSDDQRVAGVRSNYATLLVKLDEFDAAERHYRAALGA